LARACAGHEGRKRVNQFRTKRPIGLIVGSEVAGLVADVDQHVGHVRQPQAFRRRRRHSQRKDDQHGCGQLFKGSIGSSMKAEATEGCIAGAIASPCGSGSTIRPAII
jgi:hypothetical protein